MAIKVFIALVGAIVIVVLLFFFLGQLANESPTRFDSPYELLDRYIESWFEGGDALFVQFVGASARNSENSFINLQRLRESFSSRANPYLTDEDFKYLIKNHSDVNAWDFVFGKIPQRKIKWFQKESAIRLDGVNVVLILTPSFTGWKIDGLKFVALNLNGK